MGQKGEGRDAIPLPPGFSTYLDLVRFAAALAVFFASAAAYCLFIGGGLNRELDTLARETFGGGMAIYLRRSQFFASDYFLALFIGANIFAARYCDFDFKFLKPAIAFLAGNSFTFYLAHVPLLEFYALICHLAGPSLFAATSLSALAFGMAIEHRKDRLRRMLLAAWNGRFPIGANRSAMSRAIDQECSRSSTAAQVASGASWGMLWPTPGSRRRS